MDYNSTNQPYVYSDSTSAEPLGKYTAKTFGWMFAGLLITFLVAMFGYTTGTIIYVFAIPYAYLVLAVAEIAVVIRADQQDVCRHGESAVLYLCGFKWYCLFRILLNVRHG